MPGLQRLCIFNLDDVLPHVVDPGNSKRDELDHLRREFCGHRILLCSIRMRCFQKWGTKCAHCGIEGLFFALERPRKAPHAKPDRPHLNLYAMKDGKEILMTCDHVMPTSKGGPNHISNVQTLCCNCNCKKADSFDEQAQKVFHAQVREPARLASKKKFFSKFPQKLLADFGMGAINPSCQDGKTSETGMTQ